MNPETFMRAALAEAAHGLREGRGGPFGCVVVRRGQIIARGQNRVTSTHDPTAHAEITAIREACTARQTIRLDDCELYASCEPCPMCLAAIYWAHLPRVYFGATREEAAAIGFDDAYILRQVALPLEQRAVAMQPLLHDEAQAVFAAWQAKTNKVRY